MVKHWSLMIKSQKRYRNLSHYRSETIAPHLRVRSHANNWWLLSTTNESHIQGKFVSGFEPSQSSASHQIRYRNLSPLWWFQGFDPAQRGKACASQCQGSNPLNHKCNHIILDTVTFHLYGFKGSIPQHHHFQCQGSNPLNHKCITSN